MSGASMNSGSNGLHSSVHNNNYYYYQGGPQSRPEYPHRPQASSSSSPASSYSGLVDKVPPPNGTSGPQFQPPYIPAGQSKSRNKNATGRPLSASGMSTTMPVMGQR